MIEEVQEDLKLTKLEFQELKAWLFISRNIEVRVPTEGVHLIFAYGLEEASDRVVKDVPQGFYIKKVGNIPVKDLLRRIETEGFFMKTEEAESKPKTSREQFLCNLQLCADSFLKGTDKKKLKEIIENVKKSPSNL